MPLLAPVSYTAQVSGFIEYGRTGVDLRGHLLRATSTKNPLISSCVGKFWWVLDPGCVANVCGDFGYCRKSLECSSLRFFSKTNCNKTTMSLPLSPRSLISPTGELLANPSCLVLPGRSFPPYPSCCKGLTLWYTGTGRKAPPPPTPVGRQTRLKTLPFRN